MKFSTMNRYEMCILVGIFDYKIEYRTLFYRQQIQEKHPVTDPGIISPKSIPAASTGIHLAFADYPLFNTL